MSKLKEYEIDINGITHSVLLDDDEARARGLLSDVELDSAAAEEALAATLEEHRTLLEAEFEVRVEDAVKARTEDLESTFAERVKTEVDQLLEAAVAEALATAKAEGDTPVIEDPPPAKTSRAKTK